MTSFQLVALTPQTPHQLADPVVCSFPHNVPPNLEQMQFSLYEHATQKKRVLKSQSKQVKYTSTSFSADTKPKSQGSDYYIGVYEQNKDKCYLLAVPTAFQMTQKINGFQEKFSSQDSKQQMTYYDQKQILAESFGTAKALRKFKSVMTNRVEDDANVKNTKGTRDARVQEMAGNVSRDANEVKKQAANTEAKKSHLYSRAALMPEQIFDLLPYKETHEALKTSNGDKLSELLCGFVRDMAIQVWEQTWDTLNDKNEKKHILKALVYLDALISLQRMPPQFEFVLNELSQRFRGVKEQPLELILNKFCTIGVQEAGDDRKKVKSFDKSNEVQYKLMKSKEQGKTLMLHIIGLVVHISPVQSAKISFLSRILKKEEKELKNYCLELGLKLEACKSMNKETGKEVDDFVARLRSRQAAKKE